MGPAFLVIWFCFHEGNNIYLGKDLFLWIPTEADFVRVFISTMLLFKVCTKMATASSMCTNGHKLTKYKTLEFGLDVFAKF